MNATVNAKACMQYQRTTVETTLSPGKLLLMLYDGAIRSLSQAQNAVAEKDIETAHLRIIKAQDIITELRATLNMDYPVAHNLASLYDFYYACLVEANLRKDSGLLETVRQFLVELRGSWQQAVSMTERAEQPLPATTPGTAKPLNLMG